MRIGNRIAATAMAFGLVLGGSVVTAAPSQAANIPSTYNGGTGITFSYSDPSNFFYIRRTSAFTADRIAVTFYTTNGTFIRKFLITNARVGTSYGINVKDLGMKENVKYRFKLSEKSGNKSYGYVTV